MLSIDLTRPIVTVMFLVFAVLMNQVFFKPVTATLAARKDHIKALHDAATAALEEAKGLQADYASRLAVSQGQAQEAIQAALKESEQRRQAHRLMEAGVPRLWIPSVRDFVRVEEIPITGTGKIDLRALRELAQNQPVS